MAGRTSASESLRDGKGASCRVGSKCPRRSKGASCRGFGLWAPAGESGLSLWDGEGGERGPWAFVWAWAVRSDGR
eukprot:760577-Prorocentrum_minimum.AAC.1